VLKSEQKALKVAWLMPLPKFFLGAAFSLGAKNETSDDSFDRNSIFGVIYGGGVETALRQSKLEGRSQG
jgi:hypothetical protein